MKKNYFLLSMILLGINSFAQDYKMPVSSVTSKQEAQSGNEATFSADGILTTMYHSKWNQTGIPDQLDFSFNNQVKSIKSLAYFPRQTGTNGIWTNVEILYSTKDDPTNFKTATTSTITWAGDSTSKKFDFDKEIINPAVIRIKVNAALGNFSSAAEVEFYSSDQIAPIASECVIQTNEFSNYKDMKVSPLVAGSSASSFQTGENIEQSFDGDYNTLYHSNYNSTDKTFPISLIYAFDGNTPLDYLIYYPRNDGGVNGLLGKVKVSYNTIADPTYIEISTQDFAQTNDVRNISFPSQIKPSSIKLEILDGKGNFASVAEMEFYQKNSNKFDQKKYSTIFKDDLFSELNSGVNQQTIDGITTSPFVKSLAQCLLDNKYKKIDRVNEHKAYKTIASINKEYKIGNYNAYENPTGIVFSEKTTSVMFVSGIPSGESVYLRVRDSANEANVTDISYPLTNGINAIEMKNNGLGYISYYSDSNNLPNIKLNVVSGIVNGVYNTYSTTAEKWKEIVENNVYSKVDIVGYYTHLIIDKTPVKLYNVNSPQALIDKYDAITKSERELMGFFKYNKDFNTKQLVYTENKGGWFAGGTGAHLDLTWGAANSASPTGLDVWGIAHELGHVNQIRPDLKWTGTTEVTNNIYSVWATYNLIKQNGSINYLRVESETGDATNYPKVSGNRYGEFIKHTLINKKSFNDIDDDPHFRKLVPFWQLSLYYQLAGAAKGAPTLAFDNDMSDELKNTTNSPSTGIDYAHWFAYTAEQARNRDSSKITMGQNNLNFAKDLVDAVQEDLTDFFTNIGFFTPVTKEIDDYGKVTIIVTQEMIDEAKSYIKSKNYPKPVSPVMHYLNSFNVNIYKDKLKLSGKTGEGTTIVTNTNGTFLTVETAKWANAVAYETYNEEDELISVSVLGTGDVTLKNTFVDFPTEAKKVYAIGFDGAKILVYPTNLSISESIKSTDFNIVPNPIKNDSSIKITLNNSKGQYNLSVIDINGKVITNTIGNIDELNKTLNSKFKSLPKGIYVVTMKNETSNYTKKVIKE
ncbi:discoidin domain-containing protein [Empedobacter falsenii]|uniref:M60 family metallopeptidase n=1 Tax=Empedobacter falsenii TaxID=343874 RepID=UPI00257606CD|nr:M60 family metallopeptidase [Empedobacter falsenii]MDM1062469.1 discoidin domain-containing protein [Empedobacter falsenii]